MSMAREEALSILSKAPKKLLEAAAVVAETQPIEGDWTSPSIPTDDSWWEDETSNTLTSLANEFRKLANASLIEKLTLPIKRVTKRQKNRK